ncbi:hypothetical protein AMECASPLE_027509, partial [Ameca splendens]
VDMGYSDDSTLLVIPKSDSQLNDSASNQNTENKPTSRPPWVVLGACPKNQGGRLTGRSQQLNKLEWPELQRNAPVSPGKRRLRQRAAVTTTDRSETAENNGIPLENRFAPLQNENQKNYPSSENNKKFENNLHSKQSSLKLPEVMIGTRNVVSDISENILEITEKRPTLENLIIQLWMTWLRKKKKD